MAGNRPPAPAPTQLPCRKPWFTCLKNGHHNTYFFWWCWEESLKMSQEAKASSWLPAPSRASQTPGKPGSYAGTQASEQGVITGLAQQGWFMYSA